MVIRWEYNLPARVKKVYERVPAGILLQTAMDVSQGLVLRMVRYWGAGTYLVLIVANTRAGTMKHLIIAGVVAVILFAATGCSASKVHDGGGSYLAVSSSKVAFIQWHKASNGRLHGTITEDSVGGSVPAQTIAVNSAQFTGTMSGSSVTMTFAAIYFLNTHAHGTLSGSALTMWVPQSDGAVRKATFSQSDKAGYDRAVAALHSRIRHANLLAVRQQARQRGPGHTTAEHNAESALNMLYRDSSLAFGGKLSDALARFSRHIQAARAHLATEKKDALGPNKYCVAALTAGGDAKAVDGALETVQGDIQSLTPDISAVRHDMATAIARLRHLRKAGLPVPGSASVVIANASANLKQVIAKANAYIDQVNAADAHARAIANKMATGRCSGAQSGTVFRPIPHMK